MLLDDVRRVNDAQSFAMARRLARENPQTHGGEGLALAGMITGGIIGGLMLLFWLAYFGFFAIVFGIGLTAGP